VQLGHKVIGFVTSDNVVVRGAAVDLDALVLDILNPLLDHF
jgi:hypothetical protein